MSIRLMATRILCDRVAQSSICARIVQQAFLAEEPAISSQHLADSLSLTLDALRYHWRQHARHVLGISLHHLLRWARVFRAEELRRRGKTSSEIAVVLGVDESTLSRDRRQFVSAAEDGHVLRELVSESDQRDCEDSSET